MKKFLSTLLLFVLVLSTLISCGTTPTPTPTPDEDDDTVDVTDNGTAMDDPSLGQTTGGVDINNADFIDQLEQVYLNTSDPSNPSVPNYTYGIENAKLTTYYPKAEDIINVGRREVPPYGIYGFINEFGEYYDDLVDIGFTNVRLGMHSTNDLNDTVMSELCSSGISAMCTVGVKVYNSNDFASTTDYLLAESQDVFNVSGDTTHGITLENIRLADWIEATINQTFNLLDRYGPNGQYFVDNPDINYLPIRYIEICNEPNFGYMLPIRRVNADGTLGADHGNHPAKAKLYAILLVAVSEAIRVKYGDQIKIVGFSDGCPSGTDSTFTRQVLGWNMNAHSTSLLNTAIQQQEGHTLQALLGLEDGETIEMDVLKNLDVISTHPYWGTSPFTQNDNGYSPARCLNDMRKAIAAVDPTAEHRIEIWYTECGWQLKSRQYFDSSEAQQWGVFKYSNARTGVDQLTQAAFLVQNYIYALRVGVNRIDFMNMQDTDNCNYGLFNYKSGGGVGDRTWRLAGYAIQTLTTILPNPRLVKVIHEGYNDTTNSYYYMYEFESDVGGENVVLAFTAQEKQNLMVPWEDDYALVTDMVGNSQILAAENGYIRIEGGACMMYLRHVSNEMLLENGLIPSAPVEVTAQISLCWQEKREEY